MIFTIEFYKFIINYNDIVISIKTESNIMIIMIQFWERFEAQIKNLSMTKKEVASIAGINYGTFVNYATNNRIPKTEEAVKIAKAIGTSVEFLVSGEETLLDDEQELDNSLVKESPRYYSLKGKSFPTDDEEPTILVPIAPQKLSAGHGEEFLTSPGEYVGHVRILERMARGLDQSKLIAAVVKGDSMTGVQIFSGDVVVFARGYLDENGLYVVSLRGEILVKRLEFDRIHQQVVIISENKNYRPITVDAHDEGISILGKVVGWVHCHPY